MNQDVDTWELSTKEILDGVIKSIQEEMDNGILFKLLIESGWYEIIIPRYVDNKHAIDITEWLETNLSGKYKRWNRTFIFENSDDAAWFKLRWL